MRAYLPDTASGAASKRPGLTRCLESLRAGDTLVVWKLGQAVAVAVLSGWGAGWPVREGGRLPVADRSHRHRKCGGGC
ncbi:recombinase family protein [Methylovulum miyakonense]|uniref:recombinase family protein n=1 Tax=Methylovulum miyakonense TaxID=645578 RepID=UPI0009FC76B7